MACTNPVGLLLAFAESALSSLPANGGGGSGGNIARSPLMYLAGAGRVDSVNYSTCLHMLARVVALPAHPDDRDNND